jgi:hypothetical protein
MSHAPGFLIFLGAVILLFIAGMMLSFVVLLGAILAKVLIWWKHLGSPSGRIRVAAHRLGRDDQKKTAPDGRG